MVIIDVRSPSEYASGHIVGAINLPLFTDQERAEVGTLYKQVSREKAIERGLEFVGPKMVDIVRTARKLALTTPGEPLEMYCARGGMRSASVAWLLRTSGVAVNVIRGGYKAYRARFESSLATDPWQLVVVSGATGSGKTELLEEMQTLGAQVLDLEGLASHRGSVFGGVGQGEQPTTEHFINILHDRFDHFTTTRPVFCEGESMLIGHVFLPATLYKMMQNAEQILAVAPREERLDRIMKEYGALPIDDLMACFVKITKRMGPEQTRAAITALQGGDILTAASLGLDYYDKCYRKGEKVGRSIAIELRKNNMQENAMKIFEKYEKNS